MDLDVASIAVLDSCLGVNNGRLHLSFVIIRTPAFSDQVAYGDLLRLSLRPTTERATTASTLGSATGASFSTAGVRLQITLCANLISLCQQCSALMHAQGVESLILFWPERGRGARSRVRCQQLRWIYVALFSHWANQNIRTVRLHNFELDDDECEDLSHYFQLANPVATLVNHQHADSDVDTGQQVLVSQDTELWLHPVTTRHRKSIRLATTSWLDVVVDDPDDSEHCGVWVPAYAVCHLRRALVTEYRARASLGSDTTSVATTHGITSLIGHVDSMGISLPTPKRDGLRGFLGLVGAPLEDLSIVGVHNFTSCLDAVWSHCLSLRRLRLASVSSEILAPLVEAYETGACRVTTLELHSLVVPEDGTSVAALFDALADATRGISKTLQQLTFGVRRGFSSILTHTESRAVRRMLATNKTLASFVVDVDLRANPLLAAVCWAHNGTWLPGKGASLHRSAKLAFISAMVFSSRRENPTLDTDVISRVFDMAAQSKTRTVIVGIDHDLGI